MTILHAVKEVLAEEHDRRKMVMQRYMAAVALSVFVPQDAKICSKERG